MVYRVTPSFSQERVRELTFYIDHVPFVQNWQQSQPNPRHKTMLLPLGNFLFLALVVLSLYDSSGDGKISHRGSIFEVSDFRDLCPDGPHQNYLLTPDITGILNKMSCVCRASPSEHPMQFG